MANAAGDLSTTSYIYGVSLQAPAAGTTATGNGNAVDTIEIGSQTMTGWLVVGVVSGTTPTLDVKWQESADGSSGWTDIAGATFTQVTVTGNIQAITFKSAKRFVRSQQTVAGTTPVFEATTFVGGPRHTAPANVGGFSLTSAAANS